MKLRSTILGAVVLLVFGFVNYAIYQKEALIRNGEPLFVELGPRDPRSLIQGDYMALRYRIAEDLETKGVPPRGQLVVKRNTAGIAEFVRTHDGQTPLQPGELLLNYYLRYGQIEVGVNAFFFQEGTADAYAEARYGELRVEPAGTSVLIGLRGANLETLGETAK
jgi:uncharacterized membrane-anchored protein